MLQQPYSVVIGAALLQGQNDGFADRFRIFVTKAIRPEEGQISFHIIVKTAFRGQIAYQAEIHGVQQLIIRIQPGAGKLVGESGGWRLRYGVS